MCSLKNVSRDEMSFNEVSHGRITCGDISSRERTEVGSGCLCRVNVNRVD